MRRFVGVFLLSFLCMHSSIAQSNLGIHQGDSFAFTLVTWKNPDSSAYTIVGANFQNLTIQQGDTFNVTIEVFLSSDTLAQESITDNGKSIKLLDPIQIGRFFAPINFESYKTTYVSTVTTTVSDSSSVTHTQTIDTTTEFGLIQDISIDQPSNTHISRHVEMKYNKTNGVLNYLSDSIDTTSGASGSSQTSTSSQMVIAQEGYPIPTSKKSNSPILPLLGVIPALLVIGTVKKYRNRLKSQ